MRLFRLVVSFFFQKKKQKALFRFAEDQYSMSGPRGLNSLSNEAIPLSGVLLFPEKEAKSVVPLRGRPILHEADPGA
jgi:hypothetical protein